MNLQYKRSIFRAFWSGTLVGFGAFKLNAEVTVIALDHKESVVTPVSVPVVAHVSVVYSVHCAVAYDRDLLIGILWVNDCGVCADSLSV